MQADNYEAGGEKKENQTLRMGLAEPVWTREGRSGSHPGRLCPTGVCGQRAGHAGGRVHRPADVGGGEKGPAHQVGPRLT